MPLLDPYAPLLRLKAFAANLADLFAADGGLAAWAGDHFGAGFTVFGGIHAGSVNPEELPAIVLDNAILRELDRENISEPATLGGRTIEQTASMVAIFTWRESDHAKLWTQRLELADLVLAAVARDGQIGGAVSYAGVTAWDWTLTEEPRAMLAASVTGVYQLRV